jgi:hypothetical protein
VFLVTVPANDSTLKVSMEWGTELGWDFAFVQVWDEAKGDWQSLPDDPPVYATSAHDAGAIGAVVDNLPGLTGPGVNGDERSGQKDLTFDLSAYAGSTVDLAFRYITDSAATGLGFWVDNASMATRPLPTAPNPACWAPSRLRRHIPFRSPAGLFRSSAMGARSRPTRMSL